MSDKTTTLAELANTDLVLQSELTTLFASSLTTNGYQKLPGGLIIQWGEVSSSTGTEGSISITFPIPFIVECFQVIPGLDLGTWNTLNQFNVSGQILNKTTSGFTYYLQAQNTSTGAGTYKLTYIAVGR